jgi:hypothetical protein
VDDQKRCIVPEERALPSVNVRPSYAFEFGFFSRYYEDRVLTGLLRGIRTQIDAEFFNELTLAEEHRRQQHNSRMSDGSESHDAVFDRVLPESHGYRCLYDLGTALGEYCAVVATGARDPNSDRLWECVRRLPECFTCHGGYLHELAEEANGRCQSKANQLPVRNPTCVRLEKPVRNPLWEEFVEHLSERERATLRSMGASRVSRFALQVSDELSELSKAGLVPTDSCDGLSSESSDPTASAIDEIDDSSPWRPGYLGIQFDKARLVVTREGVQDEATLSPLGGRIFCKLASAMGRVVPTAVLLGAWNNPKRGLPKSKTVEDAVVELRKKLEPLGLAIPKRYTVGWSLRDSDSVTKEKPKKARLSTGRSRKKAGKTKKRK